MNKVQVFNFEQSNVRTVTVDNEPYFVGKDVAEVLGYKNTKDALGSHVDSDDKQIIQRSETATLDIPNRGLTVINESGVYSLIFGSKLDSAKRFKKWVTSEVLPSIRKTGGYQIKVPDDPMQQIVLIAQGTTKLDERVRKTEDDIEFLKNDSPLPAGQYNKVGKMVSDAIHEYVKIHGLPSSAQGKLRKDISNQINSLAGIRTRTQLRIKDFEPVCQLIEHWVPTTVTRMQLQTELDMEAM